MQFNEKVNYLSFIHTRDAKATESIAAFTRGESRDKGNQERICFLAPVRLPLLFFLKNSYV
jgi:hypothetical protein